MHYIESLIKITVKIDFLQNSKANTLIVIMFANVGEQGVTTCSHLTSTVLYQLSQREGSWQGPPLDSGR